MAKTSDPRRFGGIERLFGAAGAAALWQAHVCVVGCGGVGSWCAESLARTGINHLTIIDGDTVEESNCNRQLPAMSSTIGKSKAETLAARFRDINPQGDIRAIFGFIDENDPGALIPPETTVIVDAIDSMGAKAALIAWAKKTGREVFTSGGMGGRTLPWRIRTSDLVHARGDMLLSKLRTRLRRDYGFPAGARNPKDSPIFDIQAVYSDEPGRPCAADAHVAERATASFGTLSSVTGSAGLALAALVVHYLTNQARKSA